MRIPRLNQWDAVRVEWSDPNAVPGEWHKPTQKGMTVDGCVSVGQVYKVHADRLTLICSWDPTNKHVNGGITIPFVNISAIRKLA